MFIVVGLSITRPFSHFGGLLLHRRYDLGLGPTVLTTHIPDMNQDWSPYIIDVLRSHG